MALEFSGASGSYAYSPSASWATNYTFCGWVQLDALSGFRGIVNHSPFQFAYNAGVPEYYDGTAADAGSANASTGVWYHVAVVRAGTSVKTYVNGVIDIDTTANTINNTTTVYLGTWEGTSDMLDGRMAYARLWTVALSEAEIDAEMPSTTPVRTANLWANWPLASDLNDTSGNARHLTHGGTPSYSAQPDISGGVPVVNTPVSIQFINAATNSNSAATTTLAINKPANAKTNDVLIAALCWEVQSPTITPPDGWQQIYTSTPAGTARTHRQATYWKKLTDADIGTSSWTWTVVTGYECAGIIACYRNCLPPTVSAASTTNSSSASATAPTVSTSRAKALVLHVASNMYGTTWTAPTSPQTYNERADVRSGTANGNISITLSDSEYAAAGATGTVTATAANADYYVAGQIVLEVVAFQPAFRPRRRPAQIDVWRN